MISNNYIIKCNLIAFNNNFLLNRVNSFRRIYDSIKYICVICVNIF